MTTEAMDSRDEEVQTQAAALAESLQTTHVALLDSWTLASELKYGLLPDQMQDIRAHITRALDDVARDIPMEDILGDVQDFAILSALNQNKQNDKMRGMRIGESGRVVPLLPPVGTMEGSPSFLAYFLENNGLLESSIAFVPLELLREGFFSGIVSFLAARISGVRKWRAGHLSTGAGGSGLGISGAGIGSSAQLWEINTIGSGLSLAYHGTHVVRASPIALPGGVTTPVDVYLPMGTLYLGANAGPGGAFVFDHGVVLSVPDLSSKPKHSTLAF
jgi:hypothetical protein